MYKYFFIILLLLGSISTTHGRPWEKYMQVEEINMKIPDLKTEVTSNNITVYSRENHLLPYITIYLIFEGGQFEESVGKTGLTALWGNSLVFSGSKKYDRETLAQYMESHGSSFTFTGGMERAVFQLQSLTPFFEKDLKVALEVLSNPRFESGDIQLLVQQSLESIKQRTEHPGAVAYLSAKIIQWKGNIRGNVVNSKSIKSINRDDLIKWQKRLFKRNRFSVLVTGDFNREKLFSQIEEFSANLPSANKVLDKKKLEVSAKTRKRLNNKKDKVGFFVFPKKIPQTTILLRGPGIKHSSPDYYALKMYDFLLGGNSFNSYLTQIIRSKNGWAYSVYSHYATGKYTGSVSVFVQTANINVENVINEINRIMQHPGLFVSEKALVEAKSSLRNRFVFLYETPEKLASLQMSLLWENMPKHYLKEFLNNIDKVNLNDLKRIAKTYYHPNKFFITLVGPTPKFKQHPKWLNKPELIKIPD